MKRYLRPTETCETNYPYVPERGLAAAILRRALGDLCYREYRHQALQWFLARENTLQSANPKKSAFGYQDIIDILRLSALQVQVITNVVTAYLNKEVEHGTDATTKG